MEKLWEEMSAAEQATYEDEWVEMFVLETGAEESLARLKFDVGFDCCVYNEQVFAKRDREQMAIDAAANAYIL